MPQAEMSSPGGRKVLGPRNLAALAAAVAVLVLGYVLLAAGSTSPAAVLLVLGYCVLFPLAIAL
jgi:hypothetical protein